jgi:hypothetical protein
MDPKKFEPKIADAVKRVAVVNPYITQITAHISVNKDSEPENPARERISTRCEG